MVLPLAPTAEELAEMSPQQRAELKRKLEDNVFGADCKRDHHGRPIEQGIGSPGNENVNHLRALEAQKAGREINEAILNSVKRGVAID
jgi:hypothetical protein